MSHEPALDALVMALAAVPPYENPLNPVYEALGQEQSLTLRAIRSHSELLHSHIDQTHDQTFSINVVIVSCQRLPPTPLPAIPLGF
ncbi:MAG: hypothetical protein AB1791_00265 [Chloroflexota bacterium]